MAGNALAHRRKRSEYKSAQRYLDRRRKKDCERNVLATASLCLSVSASCLTIFKVFVRKVAFTKYASWVFLTRCSLIKEDGFL